MYRESFEGCLTPKLGSTRRCLLGVKLDTLTMSAPCRLVLQLLTYRCNAADDATGHLQTSRVRVFPQPPNAPVYFTRKGFCAGRG
jgi:hypothetical protein